VNWSRLLRPFRRPLRTLEDEAWLMRAEEKTEENERRLVELILQIQLSNFARDPHWQDPS